jgi:hypothetical protein
MGCLARNKQPLTPATPFATTLAGFSTLFARLDDLGVSPGQVLIGLEATSRAGENLFPALRHREAIREASCIPLRCRPLPNSGGCAPKRISSMPSPLRERCESAEARLGQVPSEQVAASRELLRVHHQRSGGHRSRE